MGKTLRTFIAVELHCDIQKILKDIQDDLKRSGADVKWVQPDHIHLTLKFLREISEEKIEAVLKGMESSLECFPTFSFRLNHLGAFPKTENPRIIWVGVDSGENELKRLAGVLEENLESLGFKKEERSFSPHLTIGRVRSSLNKFALSKMLKSYPPLQPMAQDVKNLVLFKSTLTSSGPLYEALKKIPLAAH